MNAAELGACPQCDLLYKRVPLKPGEKGHCPRCGARLHSRSRLNAEGLAALTVTALIAFTIANATPIVALSIQGMHSSTTLFNSVSLLWSGGHHLMALLVCLTTQIIPLLDLLFTLALLAAAPVLRRHGRAPVWFAPLFHIIHRSRPWGMVEVFMLGMVVSLVKLLHMAHLVPGTALWSFVVLAILMTIIQSFDMRVLWDRNRP